MFNNRLATSVVEPNVELRDVPLTELKRNRQMAARPFDRLVRPVAFHLHKQSTPHRVYP